ncbi:hypothetical protein CSB45_06335 [candidate division KSB3 bacterium]|uniref:Glycosyltransferase 2-like domain-containing protein n=1 Tax=candidate division KSB3 bacterium TaxID=2044937 RepID=A0A2G6E706_9BACT|nr:MAG: hypothetical protein CSB45_06335 [candidate division KSB3 bacterium]PIE30261.1 MAG: hypothetical protein CSA57_05050 [candidate division KSB3 bacterium]
MMASPCVSVCIQTYQHVRYIEHCLESVLMQKTDFPVEIILGEDESTDGTREICRAYAERYPETIRLFLRSEQDKIYIHGHKTGRFNFTENLKAAQGKYIALCEGDDYWTDPGKLQKQVNFLERHSDFAICFHDIEHVCETQQGHVVTASPKPVSTFEDILKGNFIYTASCTFRNKLLDRFPAWYFSVLPGDWPLHVLHAQYGKIGYLHEVMAAYRTHDGGLWSRQSRLDTLSPLICTARTIDRHFHSRYRPIMYPSIWNWERERIELLIHERRFDQAEQHSRRLLRENWPASPASCFMLLTTVAKIYKHRLSVTAA